MVELSAGHCNPASLGHSHFPPDSDVNTDYHFVQEVRANPQDDMPRLIYADYLDEAGDPRGELIRVQVELASLPLGAAARLELEERQEALLDAYAEEWLSPLRALGAEGVSRRCFERGLIERVVMTVKNFLVHGAELCVLAPALHRLELRQAKERIPQLCDHPLPPQITSLDLGCCGLRGAAFDGIWRAPWTVQLTELRLQINHLEDEGIGNLVKASWPRLRKLHLGNNKFSPSGVEMLSRSDMVAHLETLGLSLNAVQDLGAGSLAQSPFLANLKVLDLSSCGIGLAGIQSLSRSIHLVRLERLVLRGNPLTSAGWQAFEDPARLPALRELDIRGSYGRTEQYGAVPVPAPDFLRERFEEGLLF